MAYRFALRTLPIAALASVLALPLAAQRPALTGEKARVADAVKADLSRLATLQKTYHSRSRLFAADPRDLNFAPTSGAQVTVAYASMNAWAANASHPVISPLVCFIIVSVADAAAPAPEPFCSEARPGSAAAEVAAAGPAPTSTPPVTAPVTAAPVTPAPVTSAPVTQAQGNTAPPPRQVPTTQPQRRPTTSQARRSTTPSQTQNAPVSAVSGEVSGAARSNTRAAAPLTGAAAQAETVSATEFAQRLTAFAQEAMDVFNARPPEMVKDPYESSQEFESRRAQALAAFQRREAEFFSRSSKTYAVQLPVRDVRYDADREVLEFAVDGVALPVTRTFGDDVGAAQLTMTCYTRPVFWCSPEDGLAYEAGDLWRLPRARARELDVLRTPLTLTARFSVGRRDDSRTPTLSLLGMELQGRGQVVSRWPDSR